MRINLFAGNSKPGYLNRPFTDHSKSAHSKSSTQAYQTTGSDAVNLNNDEDTGPRGGSIQLADLNNIVW